MLDRDKIYGYDDDSERFISFQIAVVDWLASWKHHPDVVHVHDHQAALIPFMMKHCYRYQHLRDIPTVLTIHNAEYQGWLGGIRVIIFLPGIPGNRDCWNGTKASMHWPVAYDVPGK